MNVLLSNPSSDSAYRIFLLSALGSAIVHAGLLLALAYLPTSPKKDDSIPTVQVKLLPALQGKNPVPPSPLKPLTPARPNPSPPVPPSPRSQPQPLKPAPPLQASFKSSPSTPASLPQTKPVLKDTRTNQMIKSRHMMKMAVPHRPEQKPSLSPATPQRKQSPISPLKLNSQRAMPRHALPPPSNTNSTALPALKATPPASAGSTTTSPAIVSSSKPLYPRVARESGWEGTVIVRTLITTDGIPSQVEIRKSCGHETLDHAAQEAIKSWKFQPAKDGNIPIAKWVDIPIKFDLNS